LVDPSTQSEGKDAPVKKIATREMVSSNFLLELLNLPPARYPTNVNDLRNLKIEIGKEFFAGVETPESAIF
jgi:hypothetical protein